MTKAEEIARRFGNDGQNFTDTSGTPLSEVLESQAQHQETNDTGATRYVFADGSAIVTSGDAWDIEGITPFSWAESETWEDAARYQPVRDMIAAMLEERGDVVNEQAVTDVIFDGQDRIKDLVSAAHDDVGAIVHIREWMGLPPLA